MILVRDKSGRLILSLIFAASLLAALVYYISATQRLARLSDRADGSLLLIAQQRASGTAGSMAASPDKAPADVRALAANPLDPTAVSKVITARARESGDLARARRETLILRRLGWRSTTALQNLLWKASVDRDVPLMMDTLDALLRREKLLGQIYPVLNLMTQDPAFRSLLVPRLAARPPWRAYYFMSATDIADPSAIEGRYLVMRAVQRRGDRLSRNEVAPVLPRLIQIGRPAQAFELWQAHMGGTVTSPLADTSFADAALPTVPDALPVPFEWLLATGSGYFADAGRDQQGSFASIDWDGRGTPILLAQATSARAGRYRLDITSSLAGSDFVQRLGARLTCPGRDAVTFDPKLAGGGGHVVLTTPTAVECDFPSLEIYGLVQPGTLSVSVSLRTVKLTRIR